MIPGLFYFPVLSISFELSVYFCIPYSSYRIICVVATSCRDLRQVNTLQVCSYFCLILISFFSPQILVRMSLKLTRRFLLVCIETAEYSLNDCCSNSFLNPLLSDFDKTISKCYLCLFDRNSSFQPCFFFLENQ